MRYCGAGDSLVEVSVGEVSPVSPPPVASQVTESCTLFWGPAEVAPDDRDKVADAGEAADEVDGTRAATDEVAAAEDVAEGAGEAPEVADNAKEAADGGGDDVVVRALEPSSSITPDLEDRRHQ